MELLKRLIMPLLFFLQLDRALVLVNTGMWRVVDSVGVSNSFPVLEMMLEDPIWLLLSGRLRLLGWRWWWEEEGEEEEGEGVPLRNANTEGEDGWWSIRRAVEGECGSYVVTFSSVPASPASGPVLAKVSKA